MSRFGSLGTQYFDNSGEPLINGLIYFYESGTTTLKTTYSDINQAIANTNPVVLTASGRQPNVFFTGVAKAVLATSANVIIETRDPVGQTDAGGDFSEYIPSFDYPIGAIVRASNGLAYASLVTPNIGNEPSVSPTEWEPAIDYLLASQSVVPAGRVAVGDASTGLAGVSGGAIGDLLTVTGTNPYAVGFSAPAASGFELVTSASASTTLTSDKTLIVCTPTNYGMTVKMADATTCTAGAEQARIQNDSAYHIRITDNANTLLGFVPANSTVSIVCESISTAAGGWSLLGAERVGISGLLSSAQAISMSNVVSETVAVDLDGDIEICMMKGVSGHIYATAFRKSTGTFGATLLIKNDNVAGGILRYSDTAAIVAYRDTGFARAAHVLTVDPSTLTLTLGTKATFTLPGEQRDASSEFLITAIPDLPDSFVILYDTSSGNGVVAFSVSGTTCTFGSGIALSGTSANIAMIATADKIIAVSSTASTSIFARPFTVSGNTLTGGTESTTAISVTAVTMKIAPASAGKWWALMSSTSGIHGLLITLSGTIATATIALASVGPGPSDAVVVNDTKVLVFGTETTNHANIIRDVAGTATAGTSATISSNKTSWQRVGVVSGDMVVMQGQIGGGNVELFLVDCSGNSPVLSKVLSLGSPASPITTAAYSISDFRLSPGASQVYSPDGTYSETFTGATNTTFKRWKVSGKDVEFGDITFHQRTGVGGGGVGRGATHSSRWCCSGSSRLELLKLECA